MALICDDRVVGYAELDVLIETFLANLKSMGDSWGKGFAAHGKWLEGLSHNLAAYEIPRRIRFVGDLPKTITGKLSRRSFPEHEQIIS